MSVQDDGKVVGIDTIESQLHKSQTYQLYHEKPTLQCTHPSKTGFARCTHVFLCGSLIVSVFLLLAGLAYMCTEQIKLKSEMAMMQNNLLSVLELIHGGKEEQEEFEFLENSIIIQENSTDFEQDLISQTDAEQSGGVLLGREKRADRRGGNSRRSSNSRRNDKTQNNRSKYFSQMNLLISICQLAA